MVALKAWHNGGGEEREYKRNSNTGEKGETGGHEYLLWQSVKACGLPG